MSNWIHVQQGAACEANFRYSVFTRQLGHLKIPRFGSVLPLVQLGSTTRNLVIMEFD